MGWINAIVRKVKKAVATAANAGAKAIAKGWTVAKNTVKTTVAKVATAATNIKHDFNAFIAKASCILQRTWRRVRLTLRVKVRQTIAWIKENPWKTAFIVVAVILAIALPPLILHAIGFTGAGIAAGSLAAAIQSSIGAGSLFAILTSAMMGGYGVLIVVCFIVAAYALIVDVLFMWNKFGGKGSKEE